MSLMKRLSLCLAIAVCTVTPAASGMEVLTPGSKQTVKAGPAEAKTSSSASVTSPKATSAKVTSAGPVTEAKAPSTVSASPFMSSSMAGSMEKPLEGQAVMTSDPFDPATPVDEAFAKDAPGLPKELRARFDAYWTALQDQKFDGAYAYEHPLFRQKVSLHAFTTIKGSPFHTARIMGHTLQAMTPKDSRGIVNIVYSISCSVFGQKAVEKTYIDRWVECHGNWYRIARQSEFATLSAPYLQKPNEQSQHAMSRLSEIARENGIQAERAAALQQEKRRALKNMIATQVPAPKELEQPSASSSPTPKQAGTDDADRSAMPVVKIDVTPKVEPKANTDTKADAPQGDSAP